MCTKLPLKCGHLTNQNIFSCPKAVYYRDCTFIYHVYTFLLTGESKHDKYPKLQGVGDKLRYLPVALDVFRVGGTTVVGQQTIRSTCSTRWKVVHSIINNMRKQQYMYIHLYMYWWRECCVNKAQSEINWTLIQISLALTTNENQHKHTNAHVQCMYNMNRCLALIIICY